MADVGPDDELIVGEAVALDVRPASFILRAAGAAIDFLVAIAVMFAFVLGFSFAFGDLVDSALFAALTIGMLVTVTVLVPVVVETVTRGRSLGKLAIGARIVRDDGGAIGFRHAFIRALTGVLEIYLTAGGLAALVGLLNPRAKRLGDLLAGTYSQHERVPRVIEPVFGVPEALEAWARTADVGRLPDRLSRRVAAFLKQANRMTPVARQRLAAELAAEAAPYVSPLPENADPEYFLAGVAALRRDREYRAHVLEQERLARLDPVLTGLPHGFPSRDG
ncbi:RDD family protein [Naasia sp. SYSU D00057]|uniref:RDD family protein n=1 Tax=Naasia sp. SYSU D00057 TaxID=2817380 RepID=UPI001B30B70F|nr:RDD family protein [Naasia sp. SYSU D00057]